VCSTACWIADGDDYWLLNWYASLILLDLVYNEQLAHCYLLSECMKSVFSSNELLVMHLSDGLLVVVTDCNRPTELTVLKSSLQLKNKIKTEQKWNSFINVLWSGSYSLNKTKIKLLFLFYLSCKHSLTAFLTVLSVNFIVVCDFCLSPTASLTQR